MSDDRKRYQCSDGPFAGQFLWLGTRATMTFMCCAREAFWHGRYVADPKNQYLIWEDA